MTQERFTEDEIQDILKSLEPDETATFQWLMDEIRDRFGASDRFDANAPAFDELAKQLASKVR